MGLCSLLIAVHRFHFPLQGASLTAARILIWVWSQCVSTDSCFIVSFSGFPSFSLSLSLNSITITIAHPPLPCIAAQYLGIPGEADFLNRGVSACATCDGAAPRFRKVPLVVVGGGDTAAEEALFLTRFASEVHVVHRRGVLRASKVMAKRLINNPKVVMQWNSVAKRVVGDADTGVTGVVVADAATGAERTIPASGYFSAIGHEPLSKLVKDLTDLVRLPCLLCVHLLTLSLSLSPSLDLGGAQDDAGYVVPHPELGGKTYTKVPGLFACGDVQDKVYRQAVTAAGSGCEAALDATRYLEALDA